MTSMNRISKAAVFLLMTALLTNCSQSHVDSSANNETTAGIVQGQDAQPSDIAQGGQLNSIVGIYSIVSQTEDPTTHKMMVKAGICTGTLIAPDMVLTAAHCVGNGIKAGSMTVFVQALILGQGTKIAVKNFLANENFVKDSSAMNDDFAVLQLASPAPATVIPSALGSASLQIGQAPMMAAGYGMSDDRHNTPSQRDGTGLLRKTMVIDGATVVGADGGPNQSGMILANSSLTGTCFGDSGGPLLAADPVAKKIVLVGITHGGPAIYQGQQEEDWNALVSSAKDPASRQKGEDAFYAKYPDAHTCSGVDLYANVTNHVAWIQQAMATLRSQK